MSDSFIRTGETTQDQAVDARPRLLVVEDSETILMVMVSVLENQGYDVLTAADGPSAIETAAANVGRLDLVVCDVTLPSAMQGDEAVAAILEADPRPEVIFVSGDQLDVDDLPGPSPRFLAKPFKIDALVAEVRAALVAVG